MSHEHACMEVVTCFVFCALLAYKMVCGLVIFVYTQGLEILKTSLQSKMVLTDVYLRKKKSGKVGAGCVGKFFCRMFVVFAMVGAIGRMFAELSMTGHPFPGGRRTTV